MPEGVCRDAIQALGALAPREAEVQQVVVDHRQQVTACAGTTHVSELAKNLLYFGNPLIIRYLCIFAIFAVFAVIFVLFQCTNISADNSGQPTAI